MLKESTGKIAVALTILAVLAGSFAMGSQIKAAGGNDARGNAAFSIAAVTPPKAQPSQDTPLTISGAGFTSILQAGLAKHNSAVVNEANLTKLATSFVSSSQLGATLPANFPSGEYDLYVFDPGQAVFTFAALDGAVEVEIEVEHEAVEVEQSHAKGAHREMEVTFDGISVTKKKWIKVRMNGKNVPILHLRRADDNSTTLLLNVKFKDWTPGDYGLTMTYKKRTTTNVVAKNGKLKKKKIWESGSVVEDNIMRIVEPAI